MSPDRVRILMNRFGALGHPFVWGVDFELEHAFFIEDTADTADILWQVGSSGNAMALDIPDAMPDLRVVSPPAREEYAEAFGVVASGLARGDSFLTNLTTRTLTECDAGLEELFHCCEAKYKLCLKDRFVCFSPEPFVRMRDGVISAFPMKGTADASKPGAEARLLSDYKELCEHHTIVDLLRNDLNMVALDVRVERFRYLERINTARGAILQTSSEISGKLPSDWQMHVGDILFAMLPAGSICGAPKPSTLDIIREAEKLRRGWYTGVFGYFDGESMDCGVAIRCLSRDAGLLWFHSGGGITVNSDEEEEYREVLDKVYLPLKNKCHAD